LRQETASNSNRGNGVNSNNTTTTINDNLQPLDLNFSLDEYMTRSGITFKLRKTRTKKAELLLQQMFEDELDEKDLGPSLLDDEDADIDDDVVDNDSCINPPPRKLTLNTVDLI